MVETAWNEWFEHANTENNEDALEAMHDIIPSLPLRPKAVSGDQYVQFAMSIYEEASKIEIPPTLPPAQPREHPIFAIESRRRKEEQELKKPILKHKPLKKVA